MHTHIKLIGRFELTVRGGAVAVSPTTRRLLAFVCVNGRRVARAPLASAIWPDTDEHRARGNLRAVMWRFGTTATPVLRLEERTVALDPAVEVDLETMRPRCLAALHTHCVDATLGGHRALLEEVCPEIDDDWVELERERWRQLRLHVLVVHLAALRTAGRTTEADVLLRHARLGAPDHEALLAHSEVAAGHRPNEVDAVRRAAGDRDLCHRPTRTFMTRHRKEPSR